MASADGGATVARIFATELMNRGLAPPDALEVSAAVVASYPWARRIGVPSLAQQLTKRGLDPDSARDFAQILFALELFDQRLELGAVLACLREGNADANETLAIALDAARIHRELRPDLRREAPPARFGFALEIVGLLVIVVPLALLYLSIS